MNVPTRLTDTARTALRCLDLTRLGDADRSDDIEALCNRAVGPFGRVAAVCVWPRWAALARKRLPASIAVAAVANFPHGGSQIGAALDDVHRIAAAGAQEVDLVLPWRALRDGDDATAARLLDAVRAASARMTLKVILESGELGDERSITSAACLALAHGADFLKTSTGKTPNGATPQAWDCMLRAIADDPHARDRVGVKASGGIRTVADARPFIERCGEVLGPAGLHPQRLRIGASSLLDDIEAVLGGTSTRAIGEGY